jgi:predicted nucleotidyltransferase
MSDTFLGSRALDQIIDRLVDGLHPDQIYLFGSQARGQATKDSDYDLLVIVPESNLPRHQREAYSYDLLWGLPTPVDVIVLTRDEFDRTCQVKTSLASTVKANGEILYHVT